MMDGLDGLLLTRRIRSAEDGNRTRPQIPIILMTAHTEPEDVMTARDAGVTEILSKPISAETLYQRIVAIIEKPRPYVVSASYVGLCRRRRDEPGYDGPERRDNDHAVSLPPAISIGVNAE
jgi:two-component system chemotaxis response regulator CheY